MEKPRRRSVDGWEWGLDPWGGPDVEVDPELDAIFNSPVTYWRSIDDLIRIERWRNDQLRREIADKAELERLQAERHALEQRLLAYELGRAPGFGTKKHGPTPIATREEIEQAEARLVAEGKNHGHKAIAKELSISATTVRRRKAGV